MSEQRAALTDLSLRKLTAPSTGQIELYDTRTRGLSVRVGKTGTKTFFVSYRLKGDRKKRRYMLGRYEEISLSEARSRALKALAQARDGVETIRAQREPAKFAFDECVEQFIERYAKRQNKRPDAAAALLRRHFVSRWGSRDVRRIEWSHVEEVLTEVGRLNGTVEANRAFGRLRKFFNWFIAASDAKDKLLSSPCDRQRALFREQSRERVLSDDELNRLWVAATNLGYPYGQIFKLWAILGQRRNEVAAMEWAHLDLSEARWRLPARSTKNSQPHVLPLPPIAVSILKSCYRHHGSPYVFPGGRSSGKPVSGFSALKRRLDSASQVSDWTPHDLRRTQASRMAEVLKVPQDIIDLIHNHRRSSGSQVAKIYNRYGYLDEQADALDRWAAYLNDRVVVSVTEAPRRCAP